jgi:hypothetical protein
MHILSVQGNSKRRMKRHNFKNKGAYQVNVITRVSRKLPLFTSTFVYFGLDMQCAAGSLPPAGSPSPLKAKVI